MLNGFEIITAPLSEEEKKMFPAMLEIVWKRYGRENAITNNNIRKALEGKGYKITSPRLRKQINAARMMGILPNLVATSKGYYRTNEKDSLSDYIESIRQRAGAINAVADNMEKYLHTI